MTNYFNPKNLSIGAKILGGAALGTNLLGIGSLISNFAGNILNYKSQKETNEANIAMQKETNAQNQSNFDRQFAYQQYLNNNQIQMQAEDARKAGINPIAMHSGSLYTFGGSASQGVTPSVAPQVDFDAISNLFGNMLQYRLGKDSINAQERIAELNAQTSRANVTDSINAQAVEGSANRATQESIAILNANNAKVIANLDNKSREQVATASNRVMLEVAKLNADTTLSVQDKISATQKYLTEYSKSVDVDIQKQLYTMDGKSVYVALYELEKQRTNFDTSKAQRAFNNVISGIRAGADVAKGVGSILNFVKP